MKKVKLKQRYAKWHLDHPDVYVNGSGDVDDCYEEETLIHLMCCLGEPVYGVIISETMKSPHQTFKVTFKVSNLSMTYNVERRHVEFV